MDIYFSIYLLFNFYTLRCFSWLIYYGYFLIFSLLLLYRLYLRANRHGHRSYLRAIVPVMGRLGIVNKSFDSLQKFAFNNT